jgi:hypothetical protein
MTASEQTYTATTGAAVLAALARLRTALGESLDLGDPVTASALASLDAAIHLVAAALLGPTGADPADRTALLTEAVDAARATMLAARFALVHWTDSLQIGC